MVITPAAYRAVQRSAEIHLERVRKPHFKERPMFDLLIFLCFLAMVLGPAIVGSLYGIRTSDREV
jgi:hypothetical protein